MGSDDLPLTNADGVTHAWRDITRGRTVILNMFYATCETRCEPLGRLLKAVYTLVNPIRKRNDIAFVSISIDGEDGVDAIGAFADKIGARHLDGWEFYTGSASDITNLRHKLGMYVPDKVRDAVKANHSGNFVIFNDDGFVKHTKPFDNPIETARKIVQVLPHNLAAHKYAADMGDFDYAGVARDDLLQNAFSINSVYTVPFLPGDVVRAYEAAAARQWKRTFTETPPSPKCCCRKSSGEI